MRKLRLKVANPQRKRGGCRKHLLDTMPDSSFRFPTSFCVEN